MKRIMQNITIPSLKHCQILRDIICFHTQQFCYFTKDGMQDPLRINRSAKSIFQEKLESVKEYEAQGLVTPKNAKFGVDIVQIQCICWI